MKQEVRPAAEKDKGGVAEAPYELLGEAGQVTSLASADHSLISGSVNWVKLYSHLWLYICL